MAGQVTTGLSAGAQDIVFAKASTDTIVVVQISGASFTGLQFAFQGSLDGTNYSNIPAISESTATVVTGTLSPSDSTVAAWRIPSEMFVNIRMHVTALTVATSLSVNFQSGTVVGSGFLTGAGGTSLTSTYLDTATAVALNIGPTTATSVAITPNTTVAGTLGVTGAVTCSSTLSCTALTATSIAATGTVALTNNMTITDAKNIVLNATTGTKIGTATTQKLGFFNATPVVQPAANTDTSTGAAGGTTTVFLNTTFTGASGTAAYTVGGAITALKALGLLAP